MTADGENPAQLARSGGGVNDILPVWAYDGQLIYFTQVGSTESLPTQLVSYQPETGVLTLLPAQLVSYQSETGVLTLLQKTIFLRDASPSRDDHWLVAEGTDGKNIDIYLVDKFNNQTLRLTTNTAVDFDPDWKP
jgi:Tol biopolymer transport system component